MQTEIRVNSFGIGTHHPIGFIRNRKGCGDYLLVHFLSPYRIHQGEEVHVREAGECIVFSPTAHQVYGSDGMSVFGNDWVHVSGAGVKPLLQYLDIPVNTILSPSTSSFIPALLKEISRETSNHQNMWEFGVELLVKRLFFELSRAVNVPEFRLAPRNEEVHELLNRLRLDMQARCTEKWTLERMLGQVHMSRAKFISLYRCVFNTSPVEDLIAMRINLAKLRLSSTEMPVTRVAELCGFSDVYYFCRQFKKKTGMTARTFRNKGLMDERADPELVRLWKDGKSLKSHQHKYDKKNPLLQ